MKTQDFDKYILQIMNGSLNDTIYIEWLFKQYATLDSVKPEHFGLKILIQQTINLKFTQRKLLS